MNEKADAEAGNAGGHGSVAVSHAMNETKVLQARSASLLLRLVSAALCVVALVVMVMDKQTKYFIIPTTPPITLSKTAKYSGAVVLVFYVYANGVVAGYLILHAIFSAFTARKEGFSSSRCRMWLTFIGDQLMLYFLIAAAAAATEIAYLAEKGNKDSGWAAECGLFGRFCHQVGGSIIVCFLSILAMIALATLSAFLLFSSDGQRQSQYGKSGLNTTNKNFNAGRGPA